MADGAGWLAMAESELRALGREIVVPPAGDITAAVRHRLEVRIQPARRPFARASRNLGARALGALGALGVGILRSRPRWRAALVAAVAFLAILIATPQGRAAIVHVFRFIGIEFRQAPGPVRSPGSNARLPGQRRTSLQNARREASFPILVPAELGQPDEVVVSGSGRVVSLLYRGTPYGLVRLDEFAGTVNRVVFEKFVNFAKVTRVHVNGGLGLWIKGPEELIYINRNGMPVSASARLTSGNTLIWGTRGVALRLEGKLGKSAALAIADSAR